jgi:hypothetical protein
VILINKTVVGEDVKNMYQKIPRSWPKGHSIEPTSGDRMVKCWAAERFVILSNLQEEKARRLAKLSSQFWFVVESKILTYDKSFFASK